MSMLDQPQFREWLKESHGVEIDHDRPRLEYDTYQGCDSSGVPVIDAHCLVCLAQNYGQAVGERQLTDALRTFVRVLMEGPPEVARQLVTHVLHGFWEQTWSIQDLLPDRDSAAADDPGT